MSLGREHAVSSINLAIDLSSPVTDSAVPGREVKIPVESDSNKPVEHNELQMMP